MLSELTDIGINFAVVAEAIAEMRLLCAGATGAADDVESLTLFHVRKHDAVRDNA